MTNPLITMAAVNGLLAVMLGAFMSHSLDEAIVIRGLVIYYGEKKAAINTRLLFTKLFI